jgi:hypothetical protein
MSSHPSNEKTWRFIFDVYVGCSSTQQQPPCGLTWGKGAHAVSETLAGRKHASCCDRVHLGDDRQLIAVRMQQTRYGGVVGFVASSGW